MGNKSGKDQARGEKVDWGNPRLKHLESKVENGRRYIEAEIPIHNKKDFDHWSDNLDQNPGASSQFAFNPQKKEYKPSGMCGSGGIAKVEYEDYPFLLERQIKNRQTVQYQKFQEPEIWHLLYALSEVGQKFHDPGYKVGDISPKHVMMSEEGDIKIAHQFSWPDQRTNYEKALFEKDLSYLSPEEMKELSIGKSKAETRVEEAEAFSAGLTLLDATLLEQSSKLYDKKLNFDYEGLHSKKVNLQNEASYSPELKYVILNLTQFQPEDRLTLTELNKWLEPHASAIINSRPFSMGSMPPKLRQTAANNPITERVLNFQTVKGSRVTDQNGWNQPGIQRVQSQPLSNHLYSGHQMTASLADQLLPDNKQFPQRKTKTVEIPGGPTKSSRPKTITVKKQIPEAEMGRMAINTYPKHDIRVSPKQTKTRSMLPNSPLGSRKTGNEDFLKEIEEKIRYSKQNFRE